MRYNKTIITAIAILGAVTSTEARRVAYFPMELKHGKIFETESGASYEPNVATVAESIDGYMGQALRLDGYSTYVEGQLNLGRLNKFTISTWCAMETWPIIEHDVQNETESACIIGNYDTTAKAGFGFFVNRIGKVSFKFYTQGWPGEINAQQTLPLYKWNNLTAVSDGANVAFYINGVLAGTTKCKGIDANGNFCIGKGSETRKLGPFNINTVNGIIDEIEIFDDAIEENTIKSWRTDKEPNLSEAGEGKYDEDTFRPGFHGMPSRNWTNETHGLVYYNEKYHLFFQKNANGPYMSRLQWGHIVSENLYDWKELPIAIGSDKWYDIKGCWSGCVVIDDVVTNGKPNIIYTGVDYARAMIGQASPNDDNLLTWTKKVNPIIDGKPSGLSDDFRDPYFFRNGNDAYIIVGTSKDGKGACTLHKYNPTTKGWSNDGKIFFSASSAAGQGSFWEMPNITEMDALHLFTTTPLGTNEGVKAMYWTGTINADGTFNATSSQSTVELPGFAKEGFGLLSPSIMKVDGKTIAIGIVPDKLPSEQNYSMGWAHTYSLPREWSLDSDGQLIQKPYAGLESMRDRNTETKIEKTLNGSESLSNINSRQMEIIGEFTVANSDFGFTLFKTADKGAKLFYSPTTGKLTLDMRSVDRIANDANVFNGLYETMLPQRPQKGSVMKIHVFTDNSIIDIFINDKWASSVRIFPKDVNANEVEIFSYGGSTQAKVAAWSLIKGTSGVDDAFFYDDTELSPEMVDVYSISGILLRKGVHRSEATTGLPKGLYIVNNKKVMVR